jgi:hypothetical protein
MKEFLGYVIGNLSLAMFAALYFFAIIGVALNLLIHSNKRNQSSKNTPVKFSIIFLARDNRTRIVIAILSIFVTIRFLPLIFEFNAEHTEYYLAGAFIVGFGFDKILEKWKESKFGSFLKEKRDPAAIADQVVDDKG